MRTEERGWSTRDIVFTVMMALVFGLLFLGWTFVWNVAEPLKPLGLQDLLYGFWFVAGTLVAYILRRPGAAVAAETLAAAAEVLSGGAWGLTTLLSGLVQGLGAEAVFFATGYRRFSTAVMLAAGAVPALTSFGLDYSLYYRDYAPVLLMVMLAARLVSGAVIGGLFAEKLGRGLWQTGVLDNYAVDRALRQQTGEEMTG